MISTKKTFLIVYLFLLYSNVGFSAKNVIDIDRNSIVARVDRGSVTLDQVMELFGPAYYEVYNKLSTGKIPSSEVNAELQKAWGKAVTSVVRDEMFYQEALNNYESMFQKYVDSQFQTSTAKGNSVLRSNVEERIRRLMQKKQNEQVTKVINDQIKAAGGLDNLNSVLKSRGISFKEWKDRIVRKAFTYSYLYSVFEPLGVSIDPRPQQVLKYYKSHIDKFTLPGDVVFDHILVSSKKHGGKEKADEISQKIGLAILDKKISFKRAATKFSDDPIGKKNGGREVGVSNDPEREAWLRDVREAVREQKIGKLEILESPNGYHITVLRKLTKGRRIPYKKAQKSIISKIKGDVWEKQSNKFYNELKKTMMVEIKQKSVPSQLLLQRGASPKYSRKIGMSADPTTFSR